MPWEPLPDPVGEPTPLGRPLDALMARLVGSSGGATTATEVIFDRWPDIIGAGLAQFSRPARIEDRCLVVAVNDAAMGAELRWQVSTIVRRITELAGSCPIDRVRVVTT